MFVWLLKLITRHRVSTTAFASNRSASGAGKDIYRAERNINQMVATPGLARTRAILRTAIFQQIPIGHELLDSCGRSRPESLQARYVTWVENVTSLLNPDYPDLARRLQIAPVDVQTRHDSEDEGITFVHDPLWPEIWKKIRVLQEIDFKLS